MYINWSYTRKDSNIGMKILDDASIHASIHAFIMKALRLDYVGVYRSMPVLGMPHVQVQVIS